MQCIASENKLAEVLVKRDKDPILGRGPGEKLGIARIRSAESTFRGIMPCLALPIRQATTGAPAEQEFQADGTRTAESRSSAIAARA